MNFFGKSMRFEKKKDEIRQNLHLGKYAPHALAVTQRFQYFLTFFTAASAAC